MHDDYGNDDGDEDDDDDNDDDDGKAMAVPLLQGLRPSICWHQYADGQIKKVNTWVNRWMWEDRWKTTPSHGYCTVVLIYSYDLYVHEYKMCPYRILDDGGRTKARDASLLH